MGKITITRSELLKALIVTTIVSIIIGVLWLIIKPLLVDLYRIVTIKYLSISYLVIITFFIFILLAVFTHKFYPVIKQCNNVGILKVIRQKYDSEKEYIFNKISQKLKNASEIRVFYTTGEGFFLSDRNRNAIIYAIINKAKIRVLIGQKNSPFLSSVEEIEKSANERMNKSIHEEIDNVKKELKELGGKAKKFSNSKSMFPSDTIEIKYIKTEFRSSILLIEGKKKNKWGCVTLTLPPFKASDSIAFEIEGTDKDVYNNMYNDCLKHFEAVWSKAWLESEYKSDTN